MKIRLQITASPGTSFSFEHTGPSLRLGRDPEGELALAGETNQSVSWNHARIELTPSGAFLTDLNSTNGTFLNDKRIIARTAFQLGDQIQLGYTGPVLKVVELELSEELKGTAAPPPPVRAPAVRRPAVDVEPERIGMSVSRTSELPGATASGMLAAMQQMQRNIFVGASLLGACVIVLVIMLSWKPRQPESPTDKTQSNVPVANNPPVKPLPSVAPNPGPRKEVEQPASPPKPEYVDVGRYVAKPDEPPSVLVQRERDPDPWGRLQRDSRVKTGYYLVSLPGYRSKIFLDSGVHLMLWGQVPEFSKFPPVLESTVVLHAPSEGSDLDFTLDRGRVHLSNYKPDQKVAQIRVRFQQEEWKLILPDSKSEVVLELWGLYPPDKPASSEPGSKPPVTCLGLFVKGGAQLLTRTRKYELPDMSLFDWSSEARSEAQPRPMSALPTWWTDKIDPKGDKENSERLYAMLSALIDFGEGLGQSDPVLPGVLTQIHESSDPADRRLGVLCLGALDAVPHLVESLEDYQHFEVRWAAIDALQIWISRGADYDRELYRTLTEKKGYSKQTATIIWRLLHGFSPAERDDPNTYQTLIAYLGHDRLSISELAWRRLADLAPQFAKDITYNPADAESRKQACEKWKAKIPSGSVPPPPTAPKG
jgi:hypothetical protein